MQIFPESTPAPPTGCSSPFLSQEHQKGGDKEQNTLELSAGHEKVPK